MEALIQAMAGVLGMAKGQRPVQIADQIKKGLPVATVYRVSKYLAPGDSDFKYQIVSKATLARKRNSHKRLTSDQSDRVARLAKVWAFARQIWGDDEETRAFLFRAHPELGSRKPIEVALDTDLGARLVEDVLGRLKYGTSV